jgi:hypothetical protein
MQPEWVNGAVKYPKSAEVYRASGQPKLSDQVDVQRLRLVGHVLRRGEEDTVYRSLFDGFAVLRGRPGFVKKDCLQGQLTELMADADLQITDACIRDKWRAKSHLWLERKRCAAANLVLEPHAVPGRAGEEPQVRRNNRRGQT